MKGSDTGTGLWNLVKAWPSICICLTRQTLTSESLRLSFFKAINNSNNNNN